MKFMSVIGEPRRVSPWFINGHYGEQWKRAWSVVTMPVVRHASRRVPINNSIHMNEVKHWSQLKRKCLYLCLCCHPVRLSTRNRRLLCSTATLPTSDLASMFDSTYTILAPPMTCAIWIVSVDYRYGRYYGIMRDCCQRKQHQRWLQYFRRRNRYSAWLMIIFDADIIFLVVCYITFRKKCIHQLPEVPPKWYRSFLLLPSARSCSLIHINPYIVPDIRYL